MTGCCFHYRVWRFHFSYFYLFFLFCSPLVISWFQLLFGKVVVINKDSNNLSRVPSLMRQEVAIRCGSRRTHPLRMSLNIRWSLSSWWPVISGIISIPIPITVPVSPSSRMTICCVVMMMIAVTIWWPEWRRRQGKHRSFLVSCTNLVENKEEKKSQTVACYSSSQTMREFAS